MRHLMCLRVSVALGSVKEHGQPPASGLIDHVHKLFSYGLIEINAPMPREIRVRIYKPDRVLLASANHFIDILQEAFGGQKFALNELPNGLWIASVMPMD